jgi:hypothetical protein
VVEARDLQIPTSTGWGFFGSGTTTPALYCAVQLGSGTQVRTFSPLLFLFINNIINNTIKIIK